jgi:hypothetical protein
MAAPVAHACSPPTPPSEFDRPEKPDPPEKPYCLVDNSCDESQIREYNDEVDEYNDKLRDYNADIAEYIDKLKQYVSDAVAYAKCEVGELPN